MLAGPTVIVLGAGSSVDFGLPTGAELAKDIITRLSFEFDFGSVLKGDRDLAQLIQKNFQGSEVEGYFVAARDIAARLPSFKSIDDCLYTHSDDQRVMAIGKLAVARSIAHHERVGVPAGLGSADQSAHRVAISQLRSMWPHYLMQTLVTGLRRADASKVFQDLAVVSFNYDRAFEHVMYHLVQDALGITSVEAAVAMKGLRVYRPYGDIGDLPFRGDGPPYGSPSQDLTRMAARIKVYTEEMEDRPDLVEMRDRISNAYSLVFLGFGFHAQNMELLRVSGHANRPRQVLATAFHEPGPVREVYDARMASYIASPNARVIALADFDTKRFMTEYGLKLSV